MGERSPRVQAKRYVSAGMTMLALIIGIVAAQTDLKVLIAFALFPAIVNFLLIEG